MMKNKTTVNEKGFICLIGIFPFIDVLNGFFLSNNLTLPVGVIYRSLFLLYLILSIMREDFPATLYTKITYTMLIGTSMILVFQNFYLPTTLTHFINDLLVLTRYFLWVLIPYYVYQRKDRLKAATIDQLILFISIAFTVGLLVPYLAGVGNQTYHLSEVGYKGFFFSTNAITIAFMVSMSFTLDCLRKRIQLKRYDRKTMALALLFVGNFFSLLLLGTKTGIIWSFMLCGYLFLSFCKIALTQSLEQKILLGIFVLILIILGLTLGIQFILQIISDTTERIAYFYRIFDGDLVRLVTSSRSDFLKGGTEAFFDSEQGLLVWLFGQGFDYRLEILGRTGLIEMDFFDALFGLGIIGTSLLLMLLGYLTYLALGINQKKIYKGLFLLMVAYSFFAGHVLFSALSSTLFGVVLSGIVLNGEKKPT